MPVAAVVEIGPVSVRRIAPLPIVGADAAMAAAALAGIDDPVVLLDERPAAVPALWRNVIASIVESEPAALTLVVPSWWPQHRVDRIVAAARTLVTGVVAVPRSRLLTDGPGDDTAVIELADEFIAIGTAGSSALLPRACAPEAVARQAIRAAPAPATIIVDAPIGVIDGAESARRIRSALDGLGRAGVTVPITDAISTEKSPPPTMQRRPSFMPVAAAAAVAAVLCVVGVAAAHRRAPESPPGSADSTDIVEGRIAVRVPVRWTVTRVTAGPGSRRVQVSSVDDHDVALHITQSYVPGESLDATASVLRHELDEQPPGVFNEFRAVDRRAGRAVVSYREVRGTRDIGWVVLVDGATRIAIGCQSTSGHADAVVGVCDEAVRSAREITGTVPAR